MPIISSLLPTRLSLHGDPRERRSVRWALLILLLVVLALAGSSIWAQVEGERGIVPVMATNDIEVEGIEVDVTADTASEAQRKGWLEAQRLAWAKLGGQELPDGRLQDIVSAIMIEREQIGPKRYIATLGVVFDRGRASALLGGYRGRSRSAPLLLLPVTFTAGTATMYEQRNPWQRAWAEFSTGASPIDYVRPVGSGGDSLLLSYGQTGRRSRIWWRNVLDQYGATDVIVPIANLEYRWPGGPVDGTFTARYGPDNTYLTSFTMTAKNSREVPLMLARAVRRFDRIYGQALADGLLRPDPSLNLASGSADPAIARLLQIARAIEAQERAQAARDAAPPPKQEIEPSTSAPEVESNAVRFYTLQLATPDAASVDAALSAVRSAPGVRGVSTSSIAIGGNSVMNVTFAGSQDKLAAALRSRGFTVNQGPGGLSISR